MNDLYRTTVAEMLILLEGAAHELSNRVAHPITTKTQSGRFGYRYSEKSVEQAIVLKCVRLVGSARSAALLTNCGLVLDASAILRIMDELGADIRFLAGPKLTGNLDEKRHAQFLTEFFQEEFDHPEPLKSSQSRHRVGRKDIRAYLARAYKSGITESESIQLQKTVDNVMSGYIHGAAVHILDTYWNGKFEISADTKIKEYKLISDQYAQYLHRAGMDFCIAALALDHQSLSGSINKYILKTFNEYGDIKPRQ